MAGAAPDDAGRRLDAADDEAGGETRLIVWIRRAQAWVAALDGDTEMAVAVAGATGRDAIAHDHVAWGLLTLHDAVRFGDAAAVIDDMRSAVASTQGAVLLEAMCDHAAALASRDGPSLESVAERYFDFGATVLGAEAAAHAAAAFSESDGGRSSRAAALATMVRRSRGAAGPAFTWMPQALSDRELDVAVLAAGGLTSRAIGDRLFVSVRTVDNHLRSVYRKLDVSGRADLGAALRVDLVADDMADDEQGRL